MELSRDDRGPNPTHVSTAHRRRHGPAGASSTSPLPPTAVDTSSDDSGYDSSGVDTNSAGDVNLSDRTVSDDTVGATAKPALDRSESVAKGHGNGTEAVGADVVRHAYLPSAPVHRRVMESPLSSDEIFRQSHAGLFNLCIVVLVAVNSRLIIENIMKYGLLIGTGYWFSSKSLRDWPLLICCFTLPVFPLCSYFVEKLARLKFLSEPIIILLHAAITMGAILFPIFVILRCDSAILSGILLMILASVVWLKLVSYAHVNYYLRTSPNEIDKVDICSKYINSDSSCDVDIKSLAYFIVAPTLCYQPVYPRTTCIRKGWIMRQTVKLVIFTGFMGFIVEQYINPTIWNSQHPLKGNFLYAMERILKLSIPVLYFWLCMFYCVFHLWCNILSELLRFGDREFYKDWWNARTIEEYWRMWNMPVHKWMLRHIYFPCLRNGLPKNVAIGIVFFVSAVFHELIVGVPCHIFKFWAFLGIMFQIPLVILTNYLWKKFKSDMVGNMIFWSCFCIFGQPMCILLYYHDVLNRKARA